MVGELPERVRQSVAAYVGCIAGAVSRERYLELVRRAGFAGVEVVEEASFPVACMANDPTAQAVFGDLALTPGGAQGDRVGDRVGPGPGRAPGLSTAEYGRSKRRGQQAPR